MSATGNDISALLATLFAVRWSPFQYDRQMHRSMLLGMMSIGFIELHCYFSERNAWISIFDPTRPRISSDPTGHARRVVSKMIEGWKQAKPHPGSTYYQHEFVDGQVGVVSVAIPDLSNVFQRSHKSGASDPVANAALGFYRRSKNWVSSTNRANERFATTQQGYRRYANVLDGEEAKYVHSIGTSALGLLYDVVRQRMQRFGAFPNEVSIQYWNDALPLMMNPQSAQNSSSVAAKAVPTLFLPPWDLDDGVRAATLSLDLRKSTFCMEQAENANEFSRLLTLMVQVLTKIAHLHGGVFDKFTGDGCIVHFLEKEQRVLYKIDPCAAALECAIAMQIGIDWILNQMRKIIRHDSELLGAGIGVDFGKSFWSIDHQNNPVVVGRPVVGACRLCAIAKSGEIYFTNVAHRSLEDSLQVRFEQRSIVGKDLPAELKLMARVLRTSARDKSSQRRITKICEGIARSGYAGF